MPERVVWPEKTLDIALSIISNMAAIYSRSNNKLISYSAEYKQIHDFDVYHRVFG